MTLIDSYFLCWL